MSLERSLKKGDWIEAKNDEGAVIVGQAKHDMKTIGYAYLEVQVADNVVIPINVNFWDVKRLKANLIHPNELPQ